MDTAQMPQQYSNHRPHREGRTAESGPAGLDEGQRRSGGGDAHGTLPVPQEAKGGPQGPEFGWHHEAEDALVPNLRDGSVFVRRPGALRLILGSSPHPTKRSF